MKNSIKRTAAGLAAALAGGIIPLAPVQAAPLGPCGPIGVSYNAQACSACMMGPASTHLDCVGGDESVSPPQQLCNRFGACGNSYVTRPSRYHTCPSNEVPDANVGCNWAPVTKPPYVRPDTRVPDLPPRAYTPHPDDPWGNGD
jgi:hypothetical protein